MTERAEPIGLTMAPGCMCVQVLSCLTPVDSHWRVSLLVVVDIIA